MCSLECNQIFNISVKEIVTLYMKMAYGKQKKFYSKKRKLIADIDEILTYYQERGMQITVRQIYYQCVSRNLISNNKQQYNKISEVITDGRLAGLLDWDVIEDRTRYTREIPHWRKPQDIIKAAAEQYRIDTRASQPCYIECWIEKDSLVSILEDTCRTYDIACFSCRGYPSVTALREAALRFNDKQKKCVILYAGDHDPSGLKIPEAIQENLKEFNANVELRRIGLNLAQIEQLNLPPNFAKEKDPNYPEYVKKTGLKVCWELDALPPERLSAIFEQNIEELTDFDEWHKMIKIEKQHKTYFSKYINE